MSRYLYFAGGFATMLLIVLAQRVIALPMPGVAQAEAPAAAPGATDDPAATAIEDLAAWPAATRR